jgi:hypothetical protein
MGRPRNGQWVTIDGKTLGIAVESDRLSSADRTVDKVAIHAGTSFFVTMGDVITRFPYPHDPAFLSGLPDPARFRVDVVDATGVNTVGSVLVAVTRLEPVVDLQAIPEPRRKTCAPGWSPRP